MLTSKQRAYLRGLANSLETILTIGKSGISGEILHQGDTALEKRELIKGRILPDTCPVPVREAAQQLAQALSCEVVQVIGSRFVLYRKNQKEPKITLPKARKK